MIGSEVLTSRLFTIYEEPRMVQAWSFQPRTGWGSLPRSKSVIKLGSSAKKCASHLQELTNLRPDSQSDETLCIFKGCQPCSPCTPTVDQTLRSALKLTETEALGFHVASGPMVWEHRLPTALM